MTRLLDKLELTIDELRREGHPVRSLFVMSGFRTPDYNEQGVGAGGRTKLMSFYLVASRMSMRQMAGCINKALNERSNRYQQGREEEHWMHRDAQVGRQGPRRRRPRSERSP